MSPFRIRPRSRTTVLARWHRAVALALASSVGSVSSSSMASSNRDTANLPLRDLHDAGMEHGLGCAQHLHVRLSASGPVYQSSDVIRNIGCPIVEISQAQA